MTDPTYRIIGFGKNEHGFFNNPVFRSNYAAAVIAWSEFYQDPEFDGAVMIEVRHEFWDVIQEFGTENVSVECGPLGNFKVLPAPELVMV